MPYGDQDDLIIRFTSETINLALALFSAILLHLEAHEKNVLLHQARQYARYRHLGSQTLLFSHSLGQYLFFKLGLTGRGTPHAFYLSRIR